MPAPSVYVYLLLHRNLGVCKIGYSTSPETRRSGMGIRGLELLESIQCADAVEARHVEQRAHDWFHRFHAWPPESSNRTPVPKHEWFTAHPSVLCGFDEVVHEGIRRWRAYQDHCRSLSGGPLFHLLCLYPSYFAWSIDQDKGKPRPFSPVLMSHEWGRIKALDLSYLEMNPSWRGPSTLYNKSGVYLEHVLLYLRVNGITPPARSSSSNYSFGYL